MKRSVYFGALAVVVLGVAVVAIGGAQTYPVRLDERQAEPQPGGSASASLVLADGGLQFPDGTIQTTAVTGLALVPRTGQSDVFAAGDDGDLMLGVTWPNPRFTDNSNGTVTDNLTGLIWLEDANCSGGQLVWADAMATAAALFDGCVDCGGTNNDCGLTDGSLAGEWRVPNVRELRSLAHYGVFDPAVPNTTGTGQWAEGDPFSDVRSDEYWSSTTLAPGTLNAWFVNLAGGNAAWEGKTLFNFVWLVRGGQ